ncbi:ferric-dicitrate binding protein FerR (iron transport regulator) [Filimonas zeae]|uniref:Anti-sigma factor n=1 Tax=Filimonas zeae TaxID=1737353 RepID=A0A917MYF8_9BACT|nr:FecR domain-containing protein [Filimonas zeae]MDR6342017.1 ferric-dicitrate binding protein FerR (iron transport regulator) [Filimonas zeae]GGH79440.1 anti-sigma factor [Filimonas zeae]
MQDISILIQKSLAGSASVEELKELLKQLDQQEPHLRDQWLQATVAGEEENAAPVFDQERIKRLIDASMKALPAKAASNSVGVVRWLRTIAAAAVFAGLVLAVNYLYNSNRHSAAGQQQTAVAEQVIEAGDVNKNFTLPDGSGVLLYAGSTLRFKAGYNVTERHLHLLGKGCFTVKQNRQLPFVVYSTHVATTALGTVFEVWEKGDSTTVRLLNGKVSVHNYTDAQAQLVYLSPGEQAVHYKNVALTVRPYREQTERVALKPSKETEKAAAIAGLSFRQMPLEQVFKVLQTKYKVVIRFNKADVAGMMFTGAFGEQERLDAVLRVIAGINNLDVQTSEQGFIIRK